MLGHVCVLLVLVGLTLVPAGQTQNNSHPFPETGQTIGGAFWAYGPGHGWSNSADPSPLNFRKPASRANRPYTVQYFER